VQPDVVAVQRQHAEQGVEAGDQAEHGERAVEDGERARIGARAAHAVPDVVGLPGSEAQHADHQVHCAVQHIDRKQAEQVAVQHGKDGRRRLRRRRMQRVGHHAQDPGRKISHPDEQGECRCSHSCSSRGEV
jgi:hypothetical protein